MKVRGIRGAITVEADTAAAIIEATTELLQQIITLNEVEQEDVASILFTTTPDLTAVFPARAARDMGWQMVALMGFQEMDVPNGVKKCIRVLIHWNTDKQLSALQHVYLRGAEVLRPELTLPRKQ